MFNQIRLVRFVQTDMLVEVPPELDIDWDANQYNDGESGACSGCRPRLWFSFIRLALSISAITSTAFTYGATFASITNFHLHGQ
jgi:hypothetical protein